MGQGALEAELAFAIDAARQAVVAAMAVYDSVAKREDGLGVQEKSNDRGPVTEADRRANEVIVSLVAQHFPGDAILAEETADDGGRLSAERFWCIDPLDGTKEFIARNGEFSVMIGLVDRASGRPLLGVVVEPVNALLLYAVAGQGAFSQVGSGAPERLGVSSRSAPGEVRIIVSRSHPDPQTRGVVASMEPESVTPCGSVGVKIGRIVQDRADAYLNFSGRTMFWDTCAPDIILHEAGGRLTALDGSLIDYSGTDATNRVAYAATNGACHELVLEHCRRAEAAHRGER